MERCHPTSGSFSPLLEQQSGLAIYGGSLRYSGRTAVEPMGRRFRGTVVSSFQALRSEFRIIGWFLCAIVFLILSYYLVITGWTIAYTVFSVTGDTITFARFTGSYQPVLYAVLAVLVTGLIFLIGVADGVSPKG